MTVKFCTVAEPVAKNPYKPGVGTRPPYLAGRDEQLRRFARLLEDYPEKRSNLRITGLRGAGQHAHASNWARSSSVNSIAAATELGITQFFPLPPI